MRENMRWYLKHLYSWNSVDLNVIPDICFYPELSLEDGLSFARLGEQDIPEIVEFHDTYCVEWNAVFSEVDVKNRIREGHRCYIARKKGKLVGFVWYAPDRMYSPDLHSRFDYQGQLAAYNAFVKSDCRGKNIIPGLLRMGHQEWAIAGCRKCYNWNRSINESARVTYRKFRAYRVGKIHYGYFLGYFFFIPLVEKDAGIEVTLNESPWHRWKSFLRKRL